MEVIMKKLYIMLAAMACLYACQVADLPKTSDAGETPERIMLKSLLADRDTRWTVDDLSIPAEEDGWKIISNERHLAFLLEFGSKTGEKYRLDADIDFASSEIAEKMSGEIGAESFEDFEFNGNGKAISGLDLPLASGLFSRVKDVRIYDLTVRDCAVGDEENVSNLTGTGILFGSGSGRIEISGVTVSCCSVVAPCKVGGFAGAITDAGCTFASCSVNDTDVSSIYRKGISGWCGGFVGFVGRSDEKSREVPVSVHADKCHVSGGSVNFHMDSDTMYSGKFLGTLNGYDYREVFKMTECTVSTAFNGQGGLTFSSIYGDTLVGGNKYGRGRINIDGSDIAEAWDGKTVTEPARSVADYDGISGAYLVTSAEELAWFQEKTVTDKILIRKDIDLGEQIFKPLYKAAWIDGQKEDGTSSEIRNLKVVRENCGKEDGGAFIRQASGTTVHKNITFRNADIRAMHDPAADHGNAYCATLCSNMVGKYTMQNVHAYDGKLYGVNKMGGLLGRVYAVATISDCSVSGYKIENYEVNDKPEVFEKSISFITVKATFYPQGEVGGMIGFIQNPATISRCRVYETEIKATGQKDNKDYLVVTIPGRHIGTVIGDIRTSKAEHIVTITDCGTDSYTETFARQTWLDQQSGATFIGRCYAVPVIDTKGSVTVDGKNVSF